jgi:hypothetical protein
MAKKTSCPVSRSDFMANAKPVTVSINGKEYQAVPKEFSTGSLGWNINDKVNIDIGGKLVTVQVGMNLTVVGSKDLPRDAGDPQPKSDTEVA